MAEIKGKAPYWGKIDNKDTLPGNTKHALSSEQALEALEQITPNGKTLQDAQQDNDHVVISTDWGGEVCLTVPARLVACSPDNLNQLARDLGVITWDDPPDQNSSSILYNNYQDQIEKDGSGQVWGGGDGGRATNSLWVNQDLLGRTKEIQEVLLGLKTRLKMNGDN